MIECAPTESVESVQVAVSGVDAFSAWVEQVPRVFEPSWNNTVPVGVPAPGDTAATVAVKVTDSPQTSPEEGAALSVVVVFALATGYDSAGLEELPLKFVLAL